MSVPTLRWLQIHRYEQFDPVRIEFSEHENLILGVNGAGKSRLLKLLRAVLSLDFGELRGQSFDVEFELQTWRAMNADSQVIIRGRVCDDVALFVDNPGDFPGSMPRQGLSLAASLEFESEDIKFTCQLKQGEMAVKESRGAFEDVVPYLGESSLFPSSNYSDESGIAHKIFDAHPICESAYVSEADQEFQILTREIEYSWIYTRLGIRLSALDLTHRFGRLLLHNLWALITRTKMPPEPESAPLRSLSEGQEQLLKHICEALHAKGINFVPNVVREKGEHIDCRGLGLRVRFLDGTELADTELTFGQRRFLYAGLMLLTHPNAPFLMDEVDNGLHPRLVETLLDLLVGRQLFLASHNKLIIDYTNFAGPEDVQKKIHVVERGDDGRQTVRTFDEETARTVYEKISVAIQSPSEVLLAEGLW